MNVQKCPICRSKDTTIWYSENIDVKHLTFTYKFSPESQKTFRVNRCQNCTHVYCAPIPKNIYKYYEDVVDKEYLKQKKTREFSAKEVLKIIKMHKKSGIMLDVGCATGDFLKVAGDHGYSVEGLELSYWSSEIANKRGIKVYRQTLKSLSKRFSAKYDVVTLWGVIEHLENPLEEMKYLHRLLKPNGFLMIWTGDVNGLVSRILGRRWWYWQGQHIQYFTQKSLDLLGNKSGFLPIATHTYPIAATFEQMKNSLSRYRFQKLLLPLINIVFSLIPVWYLRLPGEMLWVARKK